MVAEHTTPIRLAKEIFLCKAFIDKRKGYALLSYLGIINGYNVGANARRPRRRVERLVSASSFRGYLVHGFEISFPKLLPTIYF